MFTVYLALWTVLVCTIGMLMTFVNDAIQQSGFFQDKKLSYPLTVTAFGQDVYHEWGARHYWYAWMCVALFIIMIVRIVMWANHYWDNKK